MYMDLREFAHCNSNDFQDARGESFYFIKFGLIVFCGLLMSDGPISIKQSGSHRLNANFRAVDGRDDSCPTNPVLKNPN